MKRTAFLVGIAATLGSAASCGGDINTTGGAGTTGSGGGHATSSTSASSMDASSGSGVSSTSSSGAGGSGGAPLVGKCSDDPPPGAKLAPAPKPYSGGVCPMLVAGDNMITSSKNQRDFLLALPANLQPNEKLPIIFLWHWLGGDPNDFYTKGEVQAAVDTQRFIAVIPNNKGDLFKWPFTALDSQARMDEEFAFFDDMLSCVSAQFNVNSNCVSSAGVSAGALFTDQLAGGRGDYLSSIISLSGGVDGLIKPWGHPAHKLPALVLWGGASDFCVAINFEQASKALEAALVKDGNFFLECIHNCGHSEPPLDTPPGLSKYAAIWQFAFDHPYWTSPGASLYQVKGLPMELPTWCGIGAGSATQRVGPCSGSGC
jgi:predicted esterase